MAILKEFGNKIYREDQIPIPEGDETITADPGDIVEIEYTSDADISKRDAAFAIRDVLLTKEDYPEFVLHYIKIETRKVTVQFSHAPPGGGISDLYLTKDGQITRDPRIAAIYIPVWLAIIIVMAALTVFAALNLYFYRGWVGKKPPPVGDAVITARDSKTLLGIPGVTIYVDGQSVGKTGTGGSIKVTKLLAGIHTFAGETLPGYWPPDTIKQAVIENQIINVEITYHPEDEPLPTKGWLEVYTHPVSGQVWVGGQDMGNAPIGPIELERGEYSITYGYVEGYITPKPDIATIVGNQTTIRHGYYTKPEYEDQWFEKYIRYALIGGGVILGAAVIVPEVIRQIARRGER